MFYCNYCSTYYSREKYYPKRLRQNWAERRDRFNPVQDSDEEEISSVNIDAHKEEAEEGHFSSTEEASDTSQSTTSEDTTVTEESAENVSARLCTYLVKHREEFHPYILEDSTQDKCFLVWTPAWLVFFAPILGCTRERVSQILDEWTVHPTLVGGTAENPMSVRVWERSNVE